MEKIVIRVEIDGVELSPIELAEGEQDGLYEGYLAFFGMGSLFNKERTVAPYNYTIRLTRPKTKEEELREKEAEK